MSNTAKEEHDDAQRQQLIENSANKIFTKVENAVNHKPRASRRWPTELFQNAHDAGPRPGEENVRINLVLSEDDFVFRHNGEPFDVPDGEYAALTSGGTSKEVDDSSTGRFGSGFLTTHALSKVVDLEGILETSEGYESFEVCLDRSGDKEQIREDIERSQEALAEATRLEAIPDDEPTALFKYRDCNEKVARKGIQWLRRILPYLYGTCPNLGAVNINTPHFQEEWQLTEIEKDTLDSGIVRGHTVEVSGDHNSRHFQCLRVAPTENSKSALLVVLEKSEADRWQVSIPSNGSDESDPFPRVFVQFPLIGSEFLPFNVVLEGNFSPEEERDGLMMTEEDKTLLPEALSLLPATARYAASREWARSHKLASLAPTQKAFSNESDSGEKEWWNGLFEEVAERLAQLPIIQTSDGNLPAVAESGSRRAHFLYPGFALQTDDDLDAKQFHALAEQVNELHPVALEQTTDWAKIAERWDDLNVDVGRISLKELTDHLRERAERLSNLPIDGDEPSRWLVQLYQLMADVSEELNVRKRLKKLVPNQNGNLQSPEDLFVDPGISQKVKDIAASVHDAVPSADLDPRTELLCSQTQQHLQEMEEAQELLRERTAEQKSESWVIDLITDELRELLPDGAKISEDKKKG
jgi:hypothetical protein